MKSITRDIDHQDRVHKKYMKLEGLKDLYEEWIPFRDPDHPYMKHLRQRIHRTETQLNNMRP